MKEMRNLLPPDETTCGKCGVKKRDQEPEDRLEWWVINPSGKRPVFSCPDCVPPSLKVGLT